MKRHQSKRVPIFIEYAKYALLILYFTNICGPLVQHCENCMYCIWK